MGTYPQRGTASHPIFSPCLLWPNGWMDEDATWCGGRPPPRRHGVKWGSSSPRKGHSTPHFSAHVHCGEMAGWIKMPLNTEVDLGPGNIMLDGAQLTPPRKGHSSPPLFDPCLLWPNGSPSQLLLSSCYITEKLNFEEEIKTTYKEVTENSNVSSKNLKSELKK